MVGFGPPANRLQEVETRYASQVHVHPYSAVEYVFLNTRRAPFDDVRVRQALNYALDRGEIVRIHGGPTVAEPTCQVLPPLIPGYRPSLPVHAQPDCERRVDGARPREGAGARRRERDAWDARDALVVLASTRAVRDRDGRRRHRAAEARLPRDDPHPRRRRLLPEGRRLEGRRAGGDPFMARRLSRRRGLLPAAHVRCVPAGQPDERERLRVLRPRRRTSSSRARSG